MAKEREVIQYIKEEEETYTDDDLFGISSWGADLSFRELMQRYEEGTLIKPELQRKYVWDKTEASRFVESILIGLPVPSIFLAKMDDEKMLIIDGYQRIMTMYDYIRGIFSGDSKEFKLTRTEKINKRWRGKAFTELSDQNQLKITNTTIHTIIFKQNHTSADNTSLFQVFERINATGRILLAQEIRNCVSQGAFNTLLFELNEIKEWRELFGLEEKDTRMRDMEFILRFFALASEEYLGSTGERITLKRYLNKYMNKYKNMDDTAIALYREKFTKTVIKIHNTFGRHAFCNLSLSNPNKLVTKFSPTIFDSIMLATLYTTEELGEKIKLPKKAEVARRKLLTDKKYKTAISKETMSRESIMTRIKRACYFLYGNNYEQP